ncbi:MAG: tetrahydrofolate dehydrogenase/cyclohydrolase catalytic domain-containing protein [Waddliaceae bacterium]
MIIDGKKIAQEIHNEIKEATEQLRGRKPCLAVIVVGDHPASKIYVRRKARGCEEVGIRSLQKDLPDSISEKELIQEIEQLNADPEVDGILVQLPLPKHINPSLVTSSIDPHKDVDGFHPVNVGKILIGERDGFFPCTAYGISKLLERSGVDVCKKETTRSCCRKK